MAGQDLLVCDEIRKVPGGYIVSVRFPFGSRVMGCGPVVCRNSDEVIDLLRRASLEDRKQGGSQ